MAPINSISSVDVRANQISFSLVLTEDVCLMSACVGSEHIFTVDVICICPTSPRMVGRESQRVKVLSDGDYRREVVVCCKPGGRLKGLCAFETGFDNLAGEA